MITKAKLAKESSEFTSIREAVELEKQNMLLTGTFDKQKIDIPNIYQNDIEITAAGEILIKYNEATKIIDIANAIKILGASYISNGFDEIQSISGGTTSAGETKLAKIIIEGKSEQAVTTQGGNLVDRQKCTPNTALVWSNGSSGTEAMSITTDFIAVTFNGTYSINYAAQVIFFDEHKNYLQVYNNTNNEVQTFTVNNANAKYVRLGYRSWNNGNIDMTAANLMLCVGGIQTYTPFVPDSPSPSYPSAINSVNNFDLVSSGKNMFDGLLENGAYNITTGDKVTSNKIRTVHKIKVKPSTTYVLKDFTTDCNVYILSWRNDLTFIKYEGYGIGVKSITTTADTGYLTFYINSDGTNSGQGSLNDLIQLEAGSTVTAYESFRGMNTINFPYTLRSLPDGTKDYIEIDNVAKTAKHYKSIEELIFNGTENWQFNSRASTVTFINTAGFSLSNALAGRTTHPNIGVRCTNIPNSNYSDFFYLDKPQCAIHNTSNGYTYISVNKSIASDVTTFKSYLAAQYNAGTPVTVQYKLATPVITDLTYQELQIEYPVTNIYTTSIVKPKIIGQVINK